MGKVTLEAPSEPFSPATVPTHGLVWLEKIPEPQGNWSPQERRQQGSPSRASKSKRKRHHRPTRRAISVAPSKDESNCKNSPGSSNYKNARPFCTAKHLPFCPAKHTYPEYQPAPKHCGFRTPQHRSHGQVQSCIASARAPKCSRYLPVRTATRSE